MDKKDLEKMLNSGMTIKAIADKKYKSYTAVRYWLKKYNLKSNGILRNWTHKEMVDAITNSLTISDVIRGIGLQVRPGNYRTVNNFILKNNINISHMVGKKHGKGVLKRKIC